MGVDFGLLDTKQNVQTADYKSAGSNQEEKAFILNFASGGGWSEITRVPAGKTYYITNIVFTNSEGGGAFRMDLGTGEAGSEASIVVNHVAIQSSNFLSFGVPMKFESGTRIAGRGTSPADELFMTLVGWEE